MMRSVSVRRASVLPARANRSIASSGISTSVPRLQSRYVCIFAKENQKP